MIQIQKNMKIKNLIQTPTWNLSFFKITSINKRVFPLIQHLLTQLIQGIPQSPYLIEYIGLIRLICSIICNYMSRCILEPPRASGWPYCTKPWLPSPSRLDNRSPSLAICGLRSQCLQRQIKPSKRCCRHRDAKRIITSCRNDVMHPYKRPRPDQNAVLWLPTANWTISRLCPAVCSPRTILEALTVSL